MAPDVGVAEVVQRPDDVERLVPGRAVGQDLGADLERHRAGSVFAGQLVPVGRQPHDRAVERTDPDVARRGAMEEVAGQRKRAEDGTGRRVDLHDPPAEAVPAEQLADRPVGDDPQFVVVELDALGGAQVVPGVDVAAVRLEPLDAQVAAIADPDRAVRGDRDRVRRVELAGRGAGHAPRPAVGAVRIEHDHPAIAVAIGHVDGAVGRDRDIGRPVERPLVRARDAGRPELEQDLAIERRLEHAMAAGVGQPQVAVGHQAHAVWQVEAQVPRPQVAPVAIEEDDRRDGRAAVEDDDRPVGRLEGGRHAPEPGARRQAIRPETGVRPVAQRSAWMGGPGGRRAVDGHADRSPLTVRRPPRTSR